jgi:hypothetical protein
MGVFTTRWFDGGGMQLYRLPPDPVFADDEDPQPDLATLVCLSALRDLWFSDDDDRDETKEKPLTPSLL